jgi:chemotaxis signal transduction protein
MKKVNAKNAFNVPIIDVTSMGAIKQNDDNSWSKISNVLENSSKIYGYRVDFMADVINKMTNNISRS